MRIRAGDLWASWGKLLRGNTPLLSIEVTRECPLHCPGCYARADTHAAGAAPKTADLRRDDLIAGIGRLVDRHNPIHVSLVGGEPLLRRDELDVVLPDLSRRGIVTMVVTSAVLPIPEHWCSLPGVVVTVSVDGLPAEHDKRRAPATYDRILQNIAGRQVSVHWTIVRSHVTEKDYVEKYLDFWSARPEVQHIVISVYSPQRDERTPEMLTPADRSQLADRLARMDGKYPKVLMSGGMARALLDPPPAPERCLFARMSRAYCSDLATTLEPCVLGGNPDCLQCGCAIAIALHAIAGHRIRGPLRVGHLIALTTFSAKLVNRVRGAVSRSVRPAQPS